MKKAIVVAVSVMFCAPLAHAQTAAPCTVVSPHTLCVVTVINSSTAKDNIGAACDYFQLGTSTWYAVDATDANYAGVLSKIDKSYTLGDAAGAFAGKYVAAVSGKCDGSTSLISEVQLGTAR